MPEIPDAPLLEGTIVRMDARTAQVRGEGETWTCPLRGRLFLAEGDERKPAVPGDRVRVRRLTAGEAVLEEVLPRKNALSRRTVVSAHRKQVIVANLDLVVVVVATRQPPFKPGLVDRILIAASRDGIPAALCVNKMDLAEPAEVERDVQPWRAFDLPVHLVSARTGDGVAELGERLAGRTAALLGPSGAGKSTLAMTLVPDLALETREVSRKWDRGVHTTTAATLHANPRGGFLVDTPGMRAFGLHRMSREELVECFEEIAARAPLCRFRGCAHVPEPGCAVKAAVDAGEIDRRRYDSYRRILESLAEDVK